MTLWKTFTQSSLSETSPQGKCTSRYEVPGPLYCGFSFSCLSMFYYTIYIYFVLQFSVILLPVPRPVTFFSSGFVAHPLALSNKALEFHCSLTFRKCISFSMTKLFALLGQHIQKFSLQTFLWNTKL